MSTFEQGRKSVVEKSGVKEADATENATFVQVRKIVVEKLGVKEAAVTEEATFVNDLGADSLDLVEFVMEVEKEFNITVPDEDAAKLEKVGDAVKYIDAHRK